MPKLQAYRILEFKAGSGSDGVLSTSVPDGADFIGEASVFHDGIYVWYMIPNLISLNSKKEERFLIILPGIDVPEGVKLVKILDLIMETPSENKDNPAETTQGMMIFPLYKIM